MLRDFSRKKTLVAETLSPIDAGEIKTVLFDNADQFRITVLFPEDADPETDALYWRSVSEMEDGTAYAPDTVDVGFELVPAQCAVLSPGNPSTGWIDAQPAGVRLQAVEAAAVVVVEYTTTARVTWSVNPVV